MALEQARAVVKESFLDTERQRDIALVPTNLVPLENEMHRCSSNLFTTS